MKIVPFDEARMTMSRSAWVLDYDMHSPNLSATFIAVHSRYPATGEMHHDTRDVIAFVHAGAPWICFQETQLQLQKGDVIEIKAGDHYYLMGEGTVFLAGSAAWSADRPGTIGVGE